MKSIDVRRRGRPLTFLLIVALGWVGMRFAVVSVWPEAEGPSAFAPQVAALEEPAAALASDVQSAPVEAAGAESESTSPPADTTVPSVTLVEGLEPAPPSHLENQTVPLPEAAAHNALWMAASLHTVEASDPVSFTEDNGVLQK